MKFLSPFDPDNKNRNLVATIGMFDGVHLGHELIISTLKKIASERNLSDAIVTFPIHPQYCLNRNCNLKMLMSSEEKILHLSKSGVTNCILIDFNTKIAKFSASQFMQFLHDQFNVTVLIVGYDHHFGHNRNAGFEDYVKAGKLIGVEVIKAPEYTSEIGHISSSKIRKTILEGNVAIAASMLGDFYKLSGKVVTGFQNGRKLGFPTANLQLSDSRKLIPKNGVYSVRVFADNGNVYSGVCNIGVRPTIDNEGVISIETHILDFNENIYGKDITIEFVDRIRDEEKFTSLDDLIVAIKNDIEDSIRILENK